MVSSIRVTDNIKKVNRDLKRAQKKKIPEATKWAINNTAFKLRKAYMAQAEKKFDRPTRFTINAFGVSKATPRDMSAKVFIKDTQAKYLEPQIEGGQSTKKQRSGYAVPTQRLPLNQYGNIPSKKLTVGGREIRPTKTGLGVYSKSVKGKPSELLIVFKKAINYKKIFPFFHIGEKFVSNVFPKEMVKSLKKELARK
ncbi:MAG: putative tail completion protein [Prokaryotic dsDNA virus sp.]|jgi:hypothetical protein|nr:MAG: putative tail completion protein [Prokaryotic dsDNA virus sp.]|tara:strand:- start:75 stop:665 length:591 start_codon:yes stop_codon:yes gene_type:complete